MQENFELWAACQRLYNVTPVLVRDFRAANREVRFLATLRHADDIDVDEVYDPSAILAIGTEDVEGFVRWVAAEDLFMNEPCIVVTRSASSYLEDGARALDVTVFLPATEARCERAVQMVKKASCDGTFQNLMALRREAMARNEQARKEMALRAEEEARAYAVSRIEPAFSSAAPKQQRSLWARCFGR